MHTEFDFWKPCPLCGQYQEDILSYGAVELGWIEHSGEGLPLWFFFII